MKTIEELVKERHSVRTYLDKKIEKEKVEVLNKLIDEVNKDNDLNIQLILDDKDVFDKFILSYGRLKGCNNYIALIGKKSKTLEEKLGYNGEKIVLKAQELGLNTCWVGGTYKKSIVKAHINKDEKMVCVIAIGYGETSGRPRKSKSFDNVVISKENPDWFKKGVEFALLAPTAINQQSFKLEYIKDNQVKAHVGLGHLSKVDIGIVKYHFELGANKKIEWI